MKRKISVIATLLIGIIMIFTGLVGCNTTLEQTDPDYEFTYNPPFSAPTDAFMTIDGVFDEEVYDNNHWFEHASAGVTIKMTTEFTSKGVYIAIIAYDENITHEIKYNFDENSHFIIQIVKENEPTYDVIGMGTQHTTRNWHYTFDIEKCRSYRETQFAFATNVVGEPGSGETTSFAAELFTPWEEMHYKDSQLTAEGYPERVQIYTNYRAFSKTGEAYWLSNAFLQQEGRFDTYFKYGKDGLENYYESPFVGASPTGVTASDRWTIDDNAGTAYNNENRTQVLWFKKELATGKDVQPALDYIVEAKFSHGSYGAGYYPVLGFIQYDTQTLEHQVTGYRAREMDGGNIQLVCGTRTDGLQWVGDQTFNRVVETGYNKKALYLRVVKRGGDMFYFYKKDGDTEWRFFFNEYLETMNAKTIAGFYTSGEATVSEYVYTSYENNRDAIDDILADYIYFVKTPAISRYGKVTASTLTVQKGEPITLNIVPSAGYALKNITFSDDANRTYDTVLAGLQDGKYTFTPVGDCAITAEWEKLSTDDLQEVQITLKDSSGSTIVAAEYSLSGNNNLFYYEGKANNNGRILGDFLKESTVTVAGKEYTVSGIYTLKFSGPNTHDAVYTIDLNDESKYNAKGVYIAEAVATTVNLGQVTLDNTYKTETPWAGNLIGFDAEAEHHFDEGKGLYYSDGNGTVRSYFLDSTAKNFLVKAHLTVTNSTKADHNGNTINYEVPGIVISAGGEENNIILKAANWAQDILYVQCGRHNSKDVETAISGFPHGLTRRTSTTDPYTGTLDITVARINKSYFVFDKDGNLGFYIDEDGVHLLGNKKFQDTNYEQVNREIKIMYGRSEYNAIGISNYGFAKVYYEVDVNKNDAEIIDFVGKSTVSLETSNAYTSYFTGIPVSDGWVAGTPVNLVVTSVDKSKAAKTLTLTYGASDTETVEGVYSIEDGVTVFTFIPKTNCSASVTAWTDLATISGTISAEGATLSDTVINVLGLEPIVGMVGADGKYSITIPKANYDIIFQNGVQSAYHRVELDEAEETLNATLTANYNMIGKTATVNGKEVIASTTFDNEMLIDSLDGEYDLVLDRNEMLLFLPGTATTSDFVYSTRFTGDFETTMLGIGVTDGTNSLSFQITAWSGGGAQVIVSAATWLGAGNNFTIACQNDNANRCADFTYTITKIGSSISLTAGNGENAIHILTVSLETVMVNGYPEQKAVYSFAKDWGLTMTPSTLSKEDMFLDHGAIIANLLRPTRKVEGVDVPNELMVGIFRNDVTAVDMAVKSNFALLNENHDLTVNAPAVSGMANGSVKLTLVEQTTGYSRVFTANPGENTVSVPYGTYKVRAVSSSYDVTTTGTFSANSTVINFPIKTLTGSLDGIEIDSATLLITNVAKGDNSYEKVYDFPIENGAYTLSLEKGTYNIEFMNGRNAGKIYGLVVDDNTTTIPTVTIKDATYLENGYAKVNGVEILDAPITDSATYEKLLAQTNLIGLNANADIQNYKSNRIMLPKTVTTENFEFSIEVKGTPQTGGNYTHMAGISIFNGRTVLYLGFSNWVNGTGFGNVPLFNINSGDMSIGVGGTNADNTTALPLGNTFQNNANVEANLKIKVVRTQTSITFYGGPNDIELITFTKDGYALAQSLTDTYQGVKIGGTADNVTPNIADFFGEGKELMVGYWNTWNTCAYNYTANFTITQ